MDCKKLHNDIERLKSLRSELSDKLAKATESGLGKTALASLSHEASNVADEILDRYAKDLIEQDEQDENHPNAEFIKTIKERLGFITDDTTIDQIRNNLIKYLKNDLDLSSNLLTYALKEKSSNQKELDAIFNQLNLDPDKISEIMECIKNLETLETKNYIFMLPKDKWNEGKIKLPNPENNEAPEYIAPNDLTAILKEPVYYDWSYETDGRKAEYEGNAKTLVYDESWAGKEIHHFPWSKEVIKEANENLLKPNGYHIPEKDEWADIYDNLRTKLAKEQNTTPGNIDDEQISTALREDLNLAFSGYVWRGDLEGAGSYGNFWSASEGSANDAYCLYFHSDGVNPEGRAYRYYARSVRCVTESGSY